VGGLGKGGGGGFKGIEDNKKSCKGGKQIKYL
jgi:hypothetical protein